MIWTLCRSSSLQYPDMAASSSRQFIPKSCRKKCKAIKSRKTGVSDTAKPAARAVWHGQGLQQSMSVPVSAFDRVRITPLQYIISARNFQRFRPCFRKFRKRQYIAMRTRARERGFGRLPFRFPHAMSATAKKGTHHVRDAFPFYFSGFIPCFQE